ncbi:TonB-dependent siderophore receptor [Flavobacterium cyanobacteriorum]|uniref:TonB-dependent siderophore receptor n=1 Tax=Flavobacterium cyanobacteriorum TaxID=2022802 RepID=A0A255Z9X9_9FLAO|nr:TonB-dependent receptor [Flavobacterium cyanobacteriorum]OYQ38278.1 TonB-dependent siderophore receptor [Flavobacterium cyanobacteriorum]
MNILTKKTMLFGLMLLQSVMMMAQSRNSISGSIVLSDNTPAENVSVILKGTSYRTVSNEQGYYLLNNVKPGDYTITVSGLGITTVEQSITVTEGDAATRNFTLSVSRQELEEVIIEAGKANKFSRTETPYVSRMPLKNVENAQVYNIVTKELMDDQLVTTQDDALKNVPGLYQLWSATGRAGDGGAYYASRGFVTQSLVRNGIAGAVLANADAANLDRIEVIKGPSATLFGSILTSYGGLINRVTKKPFEQWAGEVNFQAGSYGFNRLSADVNTPVNEDKSALLRINGAYNTAETFQDYGTSTSYFVAPSFTYKFSDRLTANIEAELYRLDASAFHAIYLDWTATPSGLGFNSADGLNIDFRRSFYGSDIITKTRSSNIFAEVLYKISDEWTSQSVITTSTNRANGPQAWFYLKPGNQMSRNAWRVDGTSNVLEFQQNFNGTFTVAGLKNRMLIGGDIYYVKDEVSRTLFNTGFFEFDTVDYTGAVANYYNFNQSAIEALFENSTNVFNSRTNNTVYSAYISDVINITDKLLVSAGVRFDSFQNRGVYNPATNTTTGSFAQNTFSPKFGIVYQVIQDQLSVFANYQNSFRNVLNPNAGIIAEGINPDTFEPEQANQLEFGIKANAFDNRLNASISYYNIEVDNLVRNVNATLTVQDGKQRSKGVEAEITANPIPGLNLLLGYAYNDSKMVNAAQNVNGLRPVTAGPQNLANAWVSYNLQTTRLRGLGIGFGGNYASESLIYNYNTITNGAITGSESFELPSYTVLNASLFYEQPKYRIAVKANNLTDELYFNGYTTINVQAPRTFMGSITYKF